jgi:hypothetical protein
VTACGMARARPAPHSGDLCRSASTVLIDWNQYVEELYLTCLARTSGVLALDVLVANQDRGGRRNAAFGINGAHPSEAAHFYFDYANSMNSATVGTRTQGGT